MIPVLFLLLGFAQTAKVGKYEVSLRLPADGLFSGEEMQIEYKVSDTSREDPLMGFEPVIRAKIESLVDMPSMPVMPVMRETNHPEGVPGEYGLHPIFAHGGQYRLRLNIAPPGDEPFTAEFLLDVGDPRPNRPKAANPYKLRLNGKQLRIDGPEGLVTEFETVHEKLMHLIVVSPDLKYFAHTHPEYKGKGMFEITEALPPGEVRLFADFAPRGKGGQVAMLPRKASGQAPPAPDNFRGEAKLTGALKAGRTVQLEFGSAIPVQELEPYLGAMAHLIMIHEDAETFVHSHPLEDPAKLGFSARAPKPGRYKGWVELRHKGQVLRKSFELEAK
jgi:hypothetical protein